MAISGSSQPRSCPSAVASIADVATYGRVQARKRSARKSSRQFQRCEDASDHAAMGRRHNCAVPRRTRRHPEQSGSQRSAPACAATEPATGRLASQRCRRSAKYRPLSDAASLARSTAGRHHSTPYRRGRRKPETGHTIGMNQRPKLGSGRGGLNGHLWVAAPESQPRASGRERSGAFQECWQGRA